jgi:hypothetical protein
MQPGEELIVADRIFELLSQKRPANEINSKPPADNIGGRWDVIVEFFSSTSKHSFYFEQDGKWIQGSHHGDFSVQELTGTIEGGQIN